LRDPAPALELGQALAGLRHRRLEFRDLACERRTSLAQSVAIGFQHRNRLRGLAGEVVPAAAERRHRALLEVGDALERRLQAFALGLVLRNGERQRPLAMIDRRRGVADLLGQDQERAAIGELFLGRGGRAE